MYPSDPHTGQRISLLCQIQASDADEFFFLLCRAGIESLFLKTKSNI